MRYSECLLPQEISELLNLMLADERPVQASKFHAAGRHKEHITCAEQAFGADQSNIVRESTREVTWSEIRAGRYASISPVITSTDGAGWHGRMR